MATVPTMFHGLPRENMGIVEGMEPITYHFVVQKNREGVTNGVIVVGNLCYAQIVVADEPCRNTVLETLEI